MCAMRQTKRDVLCVALLSLAADANNVITEYMYNHDLPALRAKTWALGLRPKTQLRSRRPLFRCAEHFFFKLWTRLYEIMLEAQNKSRPLIYIYMLRAPWSFCDTYAEGSALRSHPQFTRLNLNSRIRSTTSTITISSLEAAGKKKLFVSALCHSHLMKEKNANGNTFWPVFFFLFFM